jgi:hypothetical protein
MFWEALTKHDINAELVKYTLKGFEPLGFFFRKKCTTNIMAHFLSRLNLLCCFFIGMN